MAEEINEVVEETTTENNFEQELIKAQDEIKHLKASLSKSNSEAAENKRKWQATLSEQEKLANEKAEKDAEKDALLASLLNEKRVAQYQSKLMANGYDNDTASKMAEALPDGIEDDFFTAQKAFLENKYAEIRADALSNQPTISAGEIIDSVDAVTSEDFNKMGYTAKAKLKAENPELYEKLKRSN